MRFNLVATLLVVLVNLINIELAGAATGGNVAMTYGETTRLDTLDPFTSPEAAGQRLSDLIFDSLIEMGPGEAYVPSLAKSWVIGDGGTTVTLSLRDDVVWHDGPQRQGGAAKFNANDVVTTIRLLSNSASEVPNRERFNVIKSAEKTGDYTVVIRFGRALTDPLRTLMFKILPSHILGSAPALLRSSEFAKHPVGTGPYSVVKVSGSGEVLLTANSKYFRGTPQIPHIVMKAYSDQNVMAQSLMFNSLDLVTYVSPRDLGELMGDSKINVVPYDALSFSFFAMNNARGVLRDKRVRQAISQAINRQEMIDAFFQGKGRLISGPFPPSSWAYNLDVKPMGYDPERAKSLLTAAGLKYKDGRLVSPSGQPVTLSFAVPLAGESEMIKRVVLAFQGYLEAVGIKVELQFMDWLVWKKKVLAEHDYDVTIAAWSFDDASNITSLFHSSSGKPWGNNFVQYKNTEVDSLLTEADVSNDFDMKRAIYHKIHAILAEDAPYTYLWTLQHHAAHNQRLSGVRVEPFAFFKYILGWRMENNHDSN